MASPGGFFRWRQLQPVGFAHKNNPSGAKALFEKFNGAVDPAADPGSAYTGRHINLYVRAVASGIVMNERDLVHNAELSGALLGLLGKERAHINANAGNSVISRPGTQHFA